MESIQSGVDILLANRTYLYRLLQSCFGNEPTLQAFKILSSVHTKTALSLLSMEKTFAHIQDFKKEVTLNSEESIEKAASEYTRLFIGPMKLPAPPWESVYVTKERLIFQEITLQVRQCYLKYNFLPVRYHSEADDHLALELDFMYNLSTLIETAYQEGNLNKTHEILKDQKTFLDEHLLAWAPLFVSHLENSTMHPLYLGLVSILKEFLKVDSAVIDEIMASLPTKIGTQI